MKLASFWALFFLLACSDRAGEPPVKLPISIKAVQVNCKVPETIRFEVVNTSTSIVVLDRRRFDQPDFDISKVINEETDLCTNRMSFSTDEQRPTLDQLLKPHWMVNIPPGQTFTIELPAHTLLNNVNKKFLQGEIKVVFGFRELLLAVGGKETDEQIFKAACKSNEVTIKWQ